VAAAEEDGETEEEADTSRAADAAVVCRRHSVDRPASDKLETLVVCSTISPMLEVRQTRSCIE
jgi:hypothetical protein